MFPHYVPPLIPYLHHVRLLLQTSLALRHTLISRNVLDSKEDVHLLELRLRAVGWIVIGDDRDLGDVLETQLRFVACEDVCGCCANWGAYS